MYIMVASNKAQEHCHGIFEEWILKLFIIKKKFHLSFDYYWEPVCSTYRYQIKTVCTWANATHQSYFKKKRFFK